MLNYISLNMLWHPCLNTFKATGNAANSVVVAVASVVVVVVVVVLPPQSFSWHDKHHDEDVGWHAKTRHQKDDSSCGKWVLLAFNLGLICPIFVLLTTKDSCPGYPTGDSVGSRHSSKLPQSSKMSLLLYSSSLCHVLL